MNRVQSIRAQGQQVWLDYLSHELIASGRLQKLIEEDALAGVTSNPAIFQQAFAKDPKYRAALADLQSGDAEARFEALALPDIQAACDMFAPLYKQSEGNAGFVSFEVSPQLANNAQGTVAAAQRLWSAIDRPNAMIKIPATRAGLSAIRASIAAGINVNVTLMFSPRHVSDVFDAYCAGLAQRLAQGLSVAAIRSVASVFISRVDTRLDPRLPQSLVHLRGKIAIATAKLAYQTWLLRFSPQGAFAELARAGAAAQSLLWASTGTKNPAYSDVLYVESLIGRNTVNTLPESTLNAFREHGEVRGETLNDAVAQARQCVQEIAEFGIDLDAEGELLQQDGLHLFEKAFAELLAQVA